MPLTPPQQMQVQQCLTNLVGMGNGTFSFAAAFDKQTGQPVAVTGPRPGPLQPAEALGLAPVLDTASTNVGGVIDRPFTFLGQPFTVRSGFAGSNPLVVGQNQAGAYCLVSRSLTLLVASHIVSFGAGMNLDAARNLMMGQVGQLLANAL